MSSWNNLPSPLDRRIAWNTGALKTPGEYKRGTVLSLESDGKYEVLGTGSGAASAVLSDDTEEDDETAAAYRSGHFNRRALSFGVVKATKEGEEDTPCELTAADEDNDPRPAGKAVSGGRPELPGQGHQPD